MTTDIGSGPVKTREDRWKEEAGFFDQAARRTDTAALAIDPMAFRRYTRPVLRRRFSKEYRFRMMGHLEGKRVLDVGCGDGLNAVLFARMGARVTGIDISPGALEVAQRRAEVNGVAGRVTFIGSPIERADFAPGSFDVIWGDGILHHVLDELPLVMDRLVRWAHAGSLVIFSEPVNLSGWLRRVRQWIPVKTEATPGERPMLPAELALVRRYLPDLKIRHYSLLGRFERFILLNFNYERSPFLRREIVNGLDAVDWAVLSLPLVQRLAGTCVMYGHPQPADRRLAQPEEAGAERVKSPPPAACRA